MSLLESLEEFLPNVSVTESPGALVFPSRRLWDELRTNQESPLFTGPSPGAQVLEFVLNVCIIGGIHLKPEEGLDVLLRTEMQWAYKGLGWDPSDFDGVDVLHVSRDRIWIPDIVSHAYDPGRIQSDAVLETHHNSSDNLLMVTSVTDVFRASWICKPTLSTYPSDGLECETEWRLIWPSPTGPLMESRCGNERNQRKRYGEFDLVGREAHYDAQRARYVFKFARDPSRIKFTVIRPTACLTLLNAFSYRVKRWRVSYCCLLMISSTVISMSLFKEVQAKTHRIPQIVLLLFSSTLSIVVGLVLAILSDSGSQGKQEGRNLEFHSKWILLIPSALILSWSTIQ